MRLAEGRQPHRHHGDGQNRLAETVEIGEALFEDSTIVHARLQDDLGMEPDPAFGEVPQLRHDVGGSGVPQVPPAQDRIRDVHRDVEW